MTNFILHPQLQKDCTIIGDLGVCRVLLMNNKRFPWLILVPRRNNVRELFELSSQDYMLAMEDVRFAAQKFLGFTHADKMNIAALGNVVEQLHIHIVARFKDDAAWPAPVWNTSLKPLPYAPLKRAEMQQKIVQALNITKM